MRFTLLALFLSVSIFSEEVREVVVVDDPYQFYADVCDGMGCHSYNMPECRLKFVEPPQTIMMKKESSCEKEFQIRKKGAVISFCTSKIDSVCNLRRDANKPFVCLNNDKHMPEWFFYKNGDSSSREILFDLALKGLLKVKIGNDYVDRIYYTKKYKFYCDGGGQGGEMIFYDNDHWLLFRKNYAIWT